jgi:hypothetical protein
MSHPDTPSEQATVSERRRSLISERRRSLISEGALPLEEQTVSERRRDLKEKRAEDLYHIVASKMQQDGKGFCLDLYGVILYDEDILYVAAAIKRFTETKRLPLVHLDIARSNLSDKTEGLAALATQLPNLEFLFLNKCELKNDELRPFFKQLLPSKLIYPNHS